jgi:hypothetical protein
MPSSFLRKFWRRSPACLLAAALAASFMLAPPARAQGQSAASAATPGEFLKQKVPIHPACLLDAMPDWETGATKTQSFERCQAENQEIKYEITDNGTVLLDRGHNSGYFAYRPVYSDASRLLVIVYQNTGGMGTFSYIADVQFQPNSQGGYTFSVSRTFGGGDRCENGIANVIAAPSSQTLTIKSDITPSSLFEISKIPALAQRASNGDLPFCAYCCAGEATYEYHIGSNDSPKLVSLHFDPQKIHDMSDQTHIDCFLRALENSGNVADHTISPDKSDAFLKEFMDSCLR